jgi:CCR4-NOT transcriptional regulation complex NOT5 subunit
MLLTKAGTSYRLGDKDVRDKNGLSDARASIERRMEKFKECEKDMKVKNFSKLGLDRGAKQDPKQAALEERVEWLKQMIDSLNNKVLLNNLANGSAVYGWSRRHAQTKANLPVRGCTIDDV